MRLNLLQWKKLYKVTENQIKLLLEHECGAYIESGTLCRFYRQFITDGKMDKNQLPPAFKYIEKEYFVIFNYKLYDHQSGLWFLSGDDTKYLFGDDEINVLSNTNINAPDIYKELTMLNKMRVPFSENHNINFMVENESIVAAYYNYKFDRNKMNVGKALQQLPWIFKKSDSEIEMLVNTIKCKLDPDVKFSIVSGSDILYWYHGQNYASNTGSLSSSCMRYGKCQDYLKIYADNDVKMLIATDDENKLRGRALLWPKSMWNKTYWDNVEFIMDRIYGNDHTILKFKEYAQKNNWVYKNKQTYSDTKTWRVPGEYNVEEKRCRMNLKNINYEEYPYVDTFNRIDWDESCLKNYGQGTILDSIEGYTNDRSYSCFDCDEHIHEDNSYWVNDDRYCENCVTWSEYDDCYYINEDVRYSEPLSSYIHYDDAYDITHGDYSGDVTHRNDVLCVYNDDDSAVPMCDTICDSGTPVNFLMSDNQIKFDLISINGPSMKTFKASDNSEYNQSCWNTFFQTMYEVANSYNHIQGITFKYNDIEMSFIYNDNVWLEIIEVLHACIEHFSISDEYKNQMCYANT